MSSNTVTPSEFFNPETQVAELALIACPGAEELTNLIAEILTQMHPDQPNVKGSDYKPADSGPQPRETHHHSGDFVPDITQLDLRKLYLTENAADPAKFEKMKQKFFLRQ